MSDPSLVRRRARRCPSAFRSRLSPRPTSASLYVSALDEKTRAPITGLGVDAFVVREDGARARSAARHAGDLADGGRDPRRQLAGGAQPHRRHPPRADRRSSRARRPRPDVDHRRRRSPDDPARLHHRPEAACTTASARCSRCRARARRCSTRSSKSARACRSREEDRAAMVDVTTENIEFSTRHYQRSARGADRRAARRCTPWS